MCAGIGVGFDDAVGFDEGVAGNRKSALRIGSEMTSPKISPRATYLYHDPRQMLFNLDSTQKF